MLVRVLARGAPFVRREYGVTQRLCCANAARFPTDDSGWASIVGVDIVGTSLYVVGCPSPLRALGFTMRHVREAAGSTSRCAASSVSSRVDLARNAFSHGFSGPGGIRSASTS